MSKEKLMITPEDLSSIFQTYIPDNNTIFVFPTDVVMNSWIDWCVMNPDQSGVSAVSLDRFKAWDRFKSEFVCGQEENKTSIPSILRKLFVRNLIIQNSSQKFFKKIINPEFSDKATSFTDWFTKLLPSLKLWYTLRIEKNCDKELDDEDKDYLELYNRYSEFLQQNNMFEPSWINPDFSGSGQKVIVIYPELLEDYADYKNIFEESNDITIVSIPETLLFQQGPECLHFPDSRKELRRIMLKIRDLVEQKKVTYPEITLNVPSLDIYQPYLEREFEKYCIPYVIRSGRKLTVNCAGHIFEEMNDCHETGFSYDTVRTLLLDEFIPWKNDIVILKENLIRAGQQFRCICNYEELESRKTVDVWIEALSNTSQDNLRELNLYKTLKNDITSICEASTFKNLHKAWDIFKEHFLENDNFSEEANNILSRCITCLNELIDMEETYLNPLELNIDNAYDFFLNELKGKTYTPQSKLCGVNVYPYKLSAAANYKYQFVIDASQKNLEIPYKRLSFLSTEKRISLGLDKEDKFFNVSKAFIRLYSKGDCIFSYAENSFNGFAIAHNYLTENPDSDPLKELDEKDFILTEEKMFMEKKIPSNPCFTESQKNQAEKWFAKNKETVETDTDIDDTEELMKKVKFVLKENRNSDKICITQTDMKQFFPCPRHWLYSSVLKLGEDSLDSDLMSRFDIGNINHKLLEKFLNWCKESNGKKLPLTNEDGLFSDETTEKCIYDLMKTFVEQTITADYSMDFAKSPLTKVTLYSQQQKITDDIMTFLHTFCKPQEDKGFGGCTICSTEEWFSSSSQENKWNYSGRMDCVLSDDQEEIYIIDFKTYNAPPISSCIATEDDQLKDFQIPLYMKLWNENHESAKAENALFYSIPSLKSTIIVQPSAKKGRSHSVNSEEYERTLSVFDNYAADFFNHVENKQFTPETTDKNAPTYVEPFSHCSGCTYKSICRTVYSIKKGELKNDR